MKRGAPMRMTPGRGFALAAVVLATYLLWGTWATYPVQLFVVFVHESGHAIATLLTGGEVHGMEINRWLGGATFVRGGIPFITLQAGYLASALFGAAMILAAARPATARGSLGGLAALTAVCGLAFARPILGLAFPFAVA
ncbi:MAG TPA: M50 family metallopeptidase, partial [bacterium]|nr:M50 family metallopeptidase [bacterium]